MKMGGHSEMGTPKHMHSKYAVNRSTQASVGWLKSAPSNAEAKSGANVFRTSPILCEDADFKFRRMLSKQFPI